MNDLTIASKKAKEDTTPVDPDADAPNIVFTTTDVTQQKAVSNEALQTFLECQALDKTLKNQLIDVVDTAHLTGL